jgi:DNA/RNA-binding protein KIN17
MWASLSDFVQYLGKTGQCVVEQNERGWYVTYIERDASKLERTQALQRRQQGELAAEQAVSVRMQEQRVQAAIALDKVGGTIHTQATALQRTDTEEYATVQLQLAIKPTKKTTSTGAGDKVKQKSVSVFGQDDDEEEDEQPQGPPLAEFAPVVPSRPVTNNKPTSTLSSSSSSASVLKKRPRPETAEPPNKLKTQRLESEGSYQQQQHQHQQSEPWLYRDILVRIVHKTVGDGMYFKCKAAVDELVNDGTGTTARVTVLDSGGRGQHTHGPGIGDVLELDQDDLETVVPKQTGKRVRILRGRYRGKRATVVELDKNKYRAVLELSDGTRLDRVDYDDFSKVA